MSSRERDPYIRDEDGEPWVSVEYVENLEAEHDRLRKALERDAAMLDKAQTIMRKHGFKFETRLDLSEGFEKLAFTFYTLLCEVDANAREALEGRP